MNTKYLPVTRARILTFSMLFFATLAIFLITLPPSARAQIIPTQVTCTGLQSQTYTPGLTYQQQDVTVSIQANLTCVSLSNPAITSATRTLQVTVPRSCNDLLNGGTVEMETTWNTGETSIETFNYTISYTGGQITIIGQGSITEGKFLGSATTDTMNLVGDITACNTPEGLTSVNGPVSFNVLL